jgi:hypothetical protein
MSTNQVSGCFRWEADFYKWTFIHSAWWSNWKCDTVQQLARWNVEAETGGGEHNEILWSHHCHTVVMHDNICWVDEIIYSYPPTNMDDL